jgi:hypothetical protein
MPPESAIVGNRCGLNSRNGQGLMPWVLLPMFNVFILEAPMQRSAALLSYMNERRSWEVREAWADLRSRGKGWTTRAKQGLSALAKSAPELDAQAWLALPKTTKHSVRVS